MIAAVDLFPDRDPEVKAREGESERWSALRVIGKHVLGERAGVARYTVFDGYTRRLPEGLDEATRFVCVPERRLPDTRLLSVPNTLNLVALMFALLALYTAWKGSLLALVFVAVVGAYVALLRRIASKIYARRKRGQERLFKSRGMRIPDWLGTQQWVSATGDSELDTALIDYMGELEGELLGYEVGLACVNGEAWLVVDDPERQGIPPVLGKDRMRLPGARASSTDATPSVERG